MEDYPYLDRSDLNLRLFVRAYPEQENITQRQTLDATPQRLTDRSIQRQVAPGGPGRRCGAGAKRLTSGFERFRQLALFGGGERGIEPGA